MFAGKITGHGDRVLRADVGTWAAFVVCRYVVVGLYGQPPWFLLAPASGRIPPFVISVDFVHRPVEAS